MGKFDSRVKTILRDYVSKTLEANGFRKARHVYIKGVTDLSWIVEIQRSRWNDAVESEFTFNCGVFVPAVTSVYLNRPERDRIDSTDCCVWSRIGMLAEDKRDKWWKLRADDDAGSVDHETGKELVKRLTEHAFPFFSRFQTTDQVFTFLTCSRIREDKQIWPTATAVAFCYAAAMAASSLKKPKDIAECLERAAIESKRVTDRRCRSEVEGSFAHRMICPTDDGSDGTTLMIDMQTGSDTGTDQYAVNSTETASRDVNGVVTTSGSHDDSDGGQEELDVSDHGTVETTETNPDGSVVFASDDFHDSDDDNSSYGDSDEGTDSDGSDTDQSSDEEDDTDTFSSGDTSQVTLASTAATGAVTTVTVTRDDAMKESGPPGMMAVYGVSLVRIAKMRPFHGPGGPRHVVRRHRPAPQAIDRKRSGRIGQRARSQTSQHRVAEGSGVLR